MKTQQCFQLLDSSFPAPSIQNVKESNFTKSTRNSENPRFALKSGTEENINDSKLFLLISATRNKRISNTFKGLLQNLNSQLF